MASITLEGFDASYPDLEPLYREHYAEMRSRLASDGIAIPDYAPRLDEYSKASVGGYLLTFVLREDGKAIGYSNVYLTNDMHNGEFIAQEDTIFVTASKRNGAGRMLVKHILADLNQRGVKRAIISPVTDLRVGKIWRRMGFKPMSELMVYNF